MKQILLLVGIAVVLFGASAGVSYYFNRPAATPKKAQTELNLLPPEGAGRSSYSPNSAGQSQSGPLPRVVSPGFVPGADAKVAAAMKFGQQKRQLEAERTILERRKKQLEIIFDSMKKEHAALKELRKELTALMDTIENELRKRIENDSNLDAKRKDARDDLQKLKNAIVDIENDQMRLYKKRATMFEKMEPIKAAGIFTTMITEGDIATAVKILAAMDPKNTAKVIDQLPEGPTTAELVTRIVNLRQTPSKKEDTLGPKLP